MIREQHAASQLMPCPICKRSLYMRATPWGMCACCSFGHQLTGEGTYLSRAFLTSRFSPIRGNPAALQQVNRSQLMDLNFV